MEVSPLEHFLVTQLFAILMIFTRVGTGLMLIAAFLLFGQEIFNFLVQPLADRVDVPGRNPHGRSVSYMSDISCVWRTTIRAGVISRMQITLENQWKGRQDRPPQVRTCACE